MPSRVGIARHRCKGQSGRLQGRVWHVTIKDMKRSALILILAAAGLSGCGLFESVAAPPVVQPAAPAIVLAAPLGAGQSAAALDTTSAAEKAAAVGAPKTDTARELGRVVVGLGSPAEQGFWLKAPLIAAAANGRVVTADGKSVAVDLIPGSGAALLSLAAFRALGLGLTDLPEVTVFAD